MRIQALDKNARLGGCAGDDATRCPPRVAGGQRGAEIVVSFPRYIGLWDDVSGLVSGVPIPGACAYGIVPAALRAAGRELDAIVDFVAHRHWFACGCQRDGVVSVSGGADGWRRNRVPYSIEGGGFSSDGGAGQRFAWVIRRVGIGSGGIFRPSGEHVVWPLGRDGAGGDGRHRVTARAVGERGEACRSAGAAIRVELHFGVWQIACLCYASAGDGVVGVWISHVR